MRSAQAGTRLLKHNLTEMKDVRQWLVKVWDEVTGAEREFVSKDHSYDQPWYNHVLWKGCRAEDDWVEYGRDRA